MSPCEPWELTQAGDGSQKRSSGVPHFHIPLENHIPFTLLQYPHTYTTHQAQQELQSCLMARGERLR